MFAALAAALAPALIALEAGVSDAVFFVLFGALLFPFLTGGLLIQSRRNAIDGEGASATQHPRRRLVVVSVSVAFLLIVASVVEMIAWDLSVASVVAPVLIVISMSCFVGAWKTIYGISERRR